MKYTTENTKSENPVQDSLCSRIIKTLKPLAVIAAAAGIVISEYEKNHPVYACYRLDSHGRLEKPVRFVFLTDLHEKRFGRGNEKLLEMIDAVSPDAVLIGGDMPTAYSERTKVGHQETGHRKVRYRKAGHQKAGYRTGRYQKNGYRKMARRKAWHRVSEELCRKLADRYPVYYGMGNHELKLSDDYMEKIAGYGVKVLDDETVQFKDVDIVGLTLPRRCYKKARFDRPDIDELRERIGGISSDRYTVMLAHSPNFLSEYAELGPDLVLSGHFHGGTIRISGNTGLMTPQYQFFNTNCHGMKHKGDTDMIVSSGLGTHTVNIRINDRPEIVVVDIH